MPCFFHRIMLKFRLRKYCKGVFFIYKNSGFLQRKESRFYVVICLCLGESIAAYGGASGRRYGICLVR